MISSVAGGSSAKGKCTSVPLPPTSSPPEGPIAPAVSAPPHSSFEVRGYLPGDEEALVAMFSSMFRERSLAEWDSLFQRGPAGPADIRILTSDGRTIGSYAHIPVPAWVEGQQLCLAIGCDLMILPEYRGRGGAELLAKGFLAAEHGCALTFGVVSEVSGHIAERYLGTTVMGRVPQWTRFRTRGAKRNALLRSVVTLLERLYGTVSSWPRPALVVTELERIGSEVDDLARESVCFARCIRIRDSAYLRWHWVEHPEATWRIRAVHAADGALRGLAVIGVRGEQERRQGVIADLLARDPGALRALVVDAWARLVEEGCQIVTCTYLDPRPWARRAMFRSGFRPFPGPLLSCGPLAPSAGDSVRRLESWYLTHGDTDI